MFQSSSRARVEAGGRLVEEDHRRVGDQAGGEVEPPPHAAGVLLVEPVAGIGDAEALEQLVGAPARVARGQSVEPADQLEVRRAGQEPVDRRRLRSDADRARTSAASATTS